MVHITHASLSIYPPCQISGCLDGSPWSNVCTGLQDFGPCWLHQHSPFHLPFSFSNNFFRFCFFFIYLFMISFYIFLFFEKKIMLNLFSETKSSLKEIKLLLYHKEWSKLITSFFQRIGGDVSNRVTDRMILLRWIFKKKKKRKKKTLKREDFKVVVHRVKCMSSRLAPINLNIHL